MIETTMTSTTRLSIQIPIYIATLLVLGTIGYRALEPGWSLADAFYMTVITISTVGFTEIHPLSDQGRLFTTVLIFLGLFAIAIIGAHAARVLIDTEMKNVLGRKRMKKEIKALRNHYIVCGYGRIGSVISAELKKAVVPFVIIEKNESLARQAESEGCCILIGDATSDHILHQAGINHAHGVVAALDSDANNLFISLAAREIKPDIKIIARGEEYGIEDRLMRAGANTVVSPLKLGGKQIAHMILNEAQPTDRSIPKRASDVVMDKVLPDTDTQSTVDELVEQTRALTAVAIQRADGQTEMMPPGDTVVEPDDTLFVCKRATVS